MKDKTLLKFISSFGRTCLCALGQAGFVLKNSENYTLAIDPYLSDSVEELEGHMGFKRLLPKLLEPQDAVFDIVIATHPHLDHYDKDAIPELLRNPVTRLIASVGCKEYVTEQGIDQGKVVYVKPGDFIREKGFDISFISCDHGNAAPDAVGVVIKTDGKIICETGDTCLRRDFKDEYLINGRLDVLIAPINGKYGNMNEIDCAELAGLLSPKVTIPCHYGMFASHGGNVGLFYELMKERGLSVYLMTQGETVFL